MSSRLFRPADELLIQYARHHRDRRNIATHMVGVPLVVFGLAELLARPHLGLGEASVSAAWLIWGLATVWYVGRGHLGLGIAVSLVNAVLVAAAHLPAGGGASAWLGWGLGCFVVGWLLQWVGHYYEGRKPAFGDDAVAWLVGPMFVTAEALFAFGMAQPLAREIERRAGPTVLRDLAHPAA